MEIRETSLDGVTVLAMDGRLDGQTAEPLWARWSALIARGDRLFVIDLEKLVFVSSAGLRVLLLAAKQSTIAACGVSARIQQTFTISGFNRLIAIHPSVDEAVQALRVGGGAATAR